MKRWHLALCGALLGLVLATSPVRAQQAWPDRPIRLVAGAPPGGVIDTMARIIAQQFEAQFGKPILVDNRAGAAGTIAAAHVGTSAPDGYTLLVSNQSWAANPWIYRGLRYDAKRDFVPVGGFVSLPGLFVVNSASPFQTLDEVVVAARQRPGRMSFGSSGVGNAGHLGAELFQAVADIQLNHVAYKGSAPAVTDLVGGQFDFMFDFLPSLDMHIQSGRVRPLAVSSDSRLPNLPAVPTVGEAGFPAATITAWVGVYAPAATPGPVVEALAGALRRAMDDPKVQATLATYGGVPLPRTGKAFAAFSDEETAKWGEIIRRAGVPQQ